MMPAFIVVVMVALVTVGAVFGLEWDLNSRCLLRGAFTLSKLVLFVIGSPAQFRNRFRSLSTVNRSGSQNAAAAAEKTSWRLCDSTMNPIAKT